MPDKPKFKYSKQKLEQLIEDIYNGDVSEYDIPLDLYQATVEYLKDGLYRGYGQTLEEAEGADLDLLTELRENIYMFSAAKNFDELKQMTELLTNGDEVRSFDEFKEAATEVFDIHNEDYLATEYQTAIASASSAAKWVDVEEQKDVLPNLRYSAIIDENTSDICLPLNGIVAPVDDPIWNTCTPPNHFNCRCVLLQEDGDATVTPDDRKDSAFEKVDDEMDEMFKQNPGKTGEIFDKDHPYFSVPKEDLDFAKTNFGLPIPPTDEDE